MALKESNIIFSPITLLFVLLSILSSHAERDRLLQGNQLKDGEYLVSPDKVFILGFFTPISKERINGDQYVSPEIFRHNRHLGIWYKGIGNEKPVWVANRNSPIPDTSGSLRIDADGRLEILQDGKRLILLSSKLALKQTSMALLDTGNLILSELTMNGSRGRILWQSFDYPTDTLLPGMKLGISSKTQHKWEITSWVSDEVPAGGTFTLGVDPNEMSQLIIWKRGVIYWKSGNWDSGQFKHLQDSAYGFEYRSNINESFFTLTLSAAVQARPISSPEFMINEWGMLLKSYPPKVEVQRYSGSYNSDPSATEDSSFSMSSLVDCYIIHGGCTNFKLPKCLKSRLTHANRDRVTYTSRDRVTYTRREREIYANRDSNTYYMVYDCLRYTGNHILGIADCETSCLQNCSCVAYASLYRNGTGCELCSGVKQKNESDSNDYGRFHLLVDPYPQPFGRNLLRLWTIIGSIIFLSVLVLAYISYTLWRKLKMEILIQQLFYFLRRKVRAIGSHLRERGTSFVELGTTMSYSAVRRKRKLKVMYYKSHGLRLFSLEILSKATDGFSPSNKLGQGGFGAVYKGSLEGGEEVAVKRLSRSSKQGVIEFKNELKVIAKLQHTNLVTIIGCCVERGEKIVVYEYLPNKSLDLFLFDPNRKIYLDWKKRFNIIEGIAQGLLYLHKYSTLKIIHRDLKAANILLDGELNAKISDFGMARIFGGDESQAKTKKVVGTRGYMSPEYLLGKYSTMSDVFSFGVLLIETVSGKKNLDSYNPDRPLNLIGLAWELWSEDRGSELIDETVAGGFTGLYEKEQAMRCIHVGLLCVQEQPSARPSISDVAAMISNGSIPLGPPNRPGFLLRENALKMIEEFEEHSFNDASISETVGR